MHQVTTNHLEANARFSLPLFCLQLHHAYDRAARGLVDLDFAIRHWTMIPGFPTRYNASPAELAETERRVLALVRADWDSGGPRPDPARLVERSRAWLEPLVADVLARWRALPALDAWYGCFRYTIEPRPGLAAFHFYNCACPRSPFEDAAALRDDLRQCLLALRREAPQVSRIQCGSWVNNLPPIQALLPTSYVESLVETDPNGKAGLGWWGQFVARDGYLNEARAAELRGTGRFHYARLLGHCSLREALAHLGAG